MKIEEFWQISCNFRANMKITQKGIGNKAKFVLFKCNEVFCKNEVKANTIHAHCL